MKKALVVAMFLVTSLCMTACSTAAQPPVEPSTDDKPLYAEEKEQVFQAETQTLAEFNSVKIDVLAADINILPGEQWAVSYSLSDKEPIKRLAVEEGTLYLETGFNSKEYFDRNQNWFVTVTIPKDASLTDVDLDTLSGNVDIQGFSCEAAILSSTSGAIDAKGITAKEMTMESVSGKISGTDLSSDQLDVETVSSGMSVDGTFGVLKTTTVSGDTGLSGSISTKGSVKSTSGNIELVVSCPSIQASSHGPVTLNGERVESSLRLNDNVAVTLKSVSGGISIETNP